MENRVQHRLAAAGATLLAVGMFTGLWTDAALTGMVKVNIPHLALAAHLNGVLGGLWMVAVAWTMPMLSYGEVGRTRLAYLVGVPSWANWFVTAIASLWGVTGLEYNQDAHNNIIAGLLQASVVVPTLVASTGWAWGFRKRSPAS
jgi:hydroxylaminobenzene mutase